VYCCRTEPFVRDFGLLVEKSLIDLDLGESLFADDPVTD
jgi:hypothetical protein